MGIVFKKNYKMGQVKIHVMKKISLLLIMFCVFLPSYFMAQTTIQQEPNAINKEKKVIIVYGSADCHHCIDTKKFLTENKIEFVFYDIDNDRNALNEMLAKLKAAKISTNGLGIPVIDKYGEVFTNNIIFEDFLKKLK